jgi:hypothetical protein
MFRATGCAETKAVRDVAVTAVRLRYRTLLVRELS